MKKFVFVLALLLLAACSKDLTLPQQIPGVAAPAPSNFTVTTSDAIVYDLAWAISDATLVQFYRIYLVFPNTMPELLDSTSTTSAQVNTSVPTPGIVFAVTSVSTDNIESNFIVGFAE